VHPDIEGSSNQLPKQLCRKRNIIIVFVANMLSTFLFNSISCVKRMTSDWRALAACNDHSCASLKAHQQRTNVSV
jgi:hypothetical protein